jgi:hypothetical protein
MHRVRRRALIEAIKTSIGLPSDDPDEVTDPVLLAQSKRPSRERIREIAQEMAADEARRKGS